LFCPQPQRINSSKMSSASNTSNATRRLSGGRCSHMAGGQCIIQIA